MPVRNTITQHCSIGKATFEGEKVEIHYFLLMMLTNHLIQNERLIVKDIACEQAFLGARAVGRERKETLQNYFSGI